MTRKRPEPIEIGHGELLREGDRVAFLGYGYGVAVALGAAQHLAEQHDIEATVADARFAKPLDAELVARLTAEHELLITVEEKSWPAASARPCWSFSPTAA